MAISYHVKKSGSEKIKQDRRHGGISFSLVLVFLSVSHSPAQTSPQFGSINQQILPFAQTGLNYISVICYKMRPSVLDVCDSLLTALPISDYLLYFIFLPKVVSSEFTSC